MSRYTGMAHHAVVIVAILGLLATRLVASSPMASSQPSITDSPSGWSFEGIGDGRLFSDMTDRALRLDSFGNPHYVYGKYHLYHAWHDGANWSFETVDSADRVGTFASLAIGSTGTIHAAYMYDAGQTGVSKALKYAYKDGTGWHVETAVADISWVARSTSITLDSSNGLHIVWMDWATPKHAYKDSSGWHTETIDATSATAPSIISADFNTAGTLFVAYGVDTDLKAAYKDGAGWHVETIDSAGTVGAGASLAVGSDGYPRVSYQYVSGQSHAARFATKGPSGWTTTAIATWTTYTGSSYTSLALGQGDVPYVMYQRGDNYNCNSVYFGYDTGSGWWSDYLDGTTYCGYDYGFYISIAARGTHPQGVYLDVHAASLRWAKHSGSGYGFSNWALSTFDGQMIATGRNLALDSNGYPHMSYGRTGAANTMVLYYAYRNVSGWHRELVDATPSGDASYLVLDSTGHPHIAYTASCGINTCVKYATKGTGAWTVETLQSWSSYGWSGDIPSIALDNGDYPRIVYYAYPSVTNGPSLRYAYKDGTGWHIESADDQRGKYGSLRLGAGNVPYIAFYDWNTKNLKFTYKDGAGWHTSTVDTATQAGENTSLVLGTADKPNIAYFTSLGYKLSYATKDAGVWTHTAVDTQARGGFYPAIVLTSAGTPWIAHTNEVTDRLYVAYPITGTTWGRVDVAPAAQAPVGFAIRNDAQAMISFLNSYGEITVATLNGQLITRLMLPYVVRN